VGISMLDKKHWDMSRRSNFFRLAKTQKPKHEKQKPKIQNTFFKIENQKRGQFFSCRMRKTKKEKHKIQKPKTLSDEK
jgi:hypothetical protein